MHILINFNLYYCILGHSLSKRQVPSVCTGRTMCAGDDQDLARAGPQLQVKSPDWAALSKVQCV